jgi:hypothetical protein
MVQPPRVQLRMKTDYERPLLRKITLQQAKDLVLRIKNMFFNPHSPRTLPFQPKGTKPYQKPSLTTLTPEEAKLLLVARANSGDEEAADLLYSLFHDQKPLEQKDAS